MTDAAPTEEEMDDGGPQGPAGVRTTLTDSGGDGRIMLGADVEIFPGKPRPELAESGMQVYEARDRRLVTEQIAVICGRASVPRITSIGTYRHLKNPAILKLVEAGIVDWKPENRQRFALVFERPPPKRLLPTAEDKPYYLSEDKIIPTLIQPVLGVLADLRNIDLTHGAVHAQNIFFSGAEGSETAMLGECLSAAPSMRQHPLYEPLERAMAQASGRGAGTVKDDLYAFGVCVAMAARGENLMAGKTPEQIIREKLAEGSYAFMVGRERLPTGISEFLRGVLIDDETQRWDIDEAIRWLEGRRLSPKQPRAHLRAARPFIFREEKYWDLRSIANVFSQNVPDAVVVAEQDQFDLWIKRNFEDKLLQKRLGEVWEREKGGNRDRLVASVCMALDPVGPVRYKRLSIFPGGFGNALADTMAREDDIQIYGEMLTQQLFSFWVNLRFEEVTDAAGLSGAFERCRNYLSQKIPGYGMERVLYTLNKECVCMSPLLKDFFVMNPGMLLLALERMSRQATRPDSVLDRHMIAFISVREPKMVDPYLGYITSHDRGNQVIGLVRCLAAIQKRFSTGPVPGVSGWMAALGGPAVERFYDHDLRKEMGARLERVKDAGNLGAILDLIDDGRVVQDDLQRFQLARLEYFTLVQERDRIYGYLKKRRFFGHATGRQIAMLVSALLASICILGYLLFYFTRGMR